MSESLSEPAPSARNDEPLWALIAGALLGATAFYLSALWLGARIGVAAALGAAIVTVIRRELPEAATFVAAAVLSAAALATSNTAFLLSALCFGAGLALSVRRRGTTTAPLRVD